MAKRLSAGAYPLEFGSKASKSLALKKKKEMAGKMKEPKSHAEAANDSYWARKEKLMGKGYTHQIMHGINGDRKVSFTPKSKKEERLFKKTFQSKNA